MPRSSPPMFDAGPRTLLFGGLTRAHHACLKGAFASLGYRAEALPVPDNRDLEVGRQHASRGWCNPAYYTVGNLVRYLQGLREAGEERITDRYAFLTVGACGPCRFGMYEAAFRKALAETGFADLPIVLIDQVGGLAQDPGAAWLRMDRRFFVRIVRAVIVGTSSTTSRAGSAPTRRRQAIRTGRSARRSSWRRWRSPGVGRFPGCCAPCAISSARSRSTCFA